MKTLLCQNENQTERLLQQKFIWGRSRFCIEHVNLKNWTVWNQKAHSDEPLKPHWSLIHQTAVSLNYRKSISASSLTSTRFSSFFFLSVLEIMRIKSHFLWNFICFLQKRETSKDEDLHPPEPQAFMDSHQPPPPPPRAVLLQLDGRPSVRSWPDRTGTGLWWSRNCGIRLSGNTSRWRPLSSSSPKLWPHKDGGGEQTEAHSALTEKTLRDPQPCSARSQTEPKDPRMLGTLRSRCTARWVTSLLLILMKHQNISCWR